MKMRAGKAAIVASSTSGLGVATARSGIHVVLNGFGSADEIDKIVDGGWTAH
jgi:hypothetical protein